MRGLKGFLSYLSDFIKVIAAGLIILIAIIILFYSINILMNGLKYSLSIVRISGTIYDSLFLINLYNPNENIFISFFLLFIIFFVILLLINLLGWFLKQDLLRIQEFLWRSFIPVWITMWLALSLDEKGFSIIVSIISLYAILLPLIKKVELTRSNDQ
ncbi:hypothetical protein D3H64_08715 [Atopobacter sp. AH10]|uniref:hypothetical protein n=1 Tax=Atopobacter sp. AH10 TaxID=2315861 RepID=UPI000EF26C84|nr:hypothetical protein [Atopobacter sp. AH10]RLK62625.1 hypothetical protein D3H64_08715 [Atopobacter sp. AH10]